MHATLSLSSSALAWGARPVRSMESFARQSDAQLVTLTLDGQRDAFGELVRRHQTRAYNAALRVVANRQDALDVTQDAFVRAYDALASFDRARPFAPWLCTIVTNLALNLVQRKHPAEALDEDNVAAFASDPVHHILETERQARVQQALRELPPAWRAVIELRHFQELSYDEIAVALNLPLSDVKSHLFRARQKLKQLLEPIE
ncbi:MAG: sigma-70 family RNA polymerase sigma factor [Chloroflexi bacterium]|nr:sigma-70 family RNA polymerase sigma factor [Chloroflexota bacterium]